VVSSPGCNCEHIYVCNLHPASMCVCVCVRERERERERVVFCLSINVDDQVAISLHTNFHWILVFYEQYDYISNIPKFIQYY
jgi:hypothetical protein